MHDTIIIGAGPAGMTAGIYAARREMKTLIIGKEIGGQIMLTSVIENYPGFKSVESFDLITKMQDQVKSFGVEIKNAEVKSITKESDGSFSLFTSKDTIRTKTIIIAMGLMPRRLAIPGEKEFTGKGVSYCAICDGPLFRDKIVAVVGGGNSALDAAEVLSKITARTYLIHRREEFRAFEALADEIKGRENIKLLLNSELKEITGKDKLSRVKVVNKKTNETKDLELDGLFIEIGRIAHTDLVADLVKRNDQNQIIVDEKCRTLTDGVFAAGDVTTVPYKQITVACGQATIAALAAYEYIQLKAGKKVNAILDRGKLKL